MEGDVAPDRIEGTVAFEEGREEAILASSSAVEAAVDGAIWTGTGVVLLKWRPRQAISIRCLFDRGVGRGPDGGFGSVAERITELTFDGRRIAGFGTKATPSWDDDVTKVLVEWRPGNLPVQGEGGEGTRVDRVRFSLFNFDLPGELYHNGKRVVQRIELRDEQWTVRIEALMPPEEVWTRINEEGGVHLTHAGSVVRTDGADFTGAQASEALDALEDYLAFAAGRRITACCPVGEIGGQSVWSRWSAPERWEAGRDSWFDYRLPQTLGEVFPEFMAKRRQGDWRDGLGEAVYWYRIANDSARGIDAGLVCAHTALERLSYEVCVRDRRIVGERGFRKKASAKRLRSLLMELKLPLDIPSRAKSLSEAVERSESSEQDAAQAVANIRDDLVHGGRGRSETTPECYIEAWKLAVWMVEMVILSLCGYRGRYWNRSSRETEEVPRVKVARG